MKKIHLLFTLFPFTFLFAQEIYQFKADSVSLNNRLELKGSLEHFATNISSGIQNKLLFGGFISNEVIEKNVAKQRELNYLGVDVPVEMIYLNGNKGFIKDSLAWGIKAGSYTFGGVNYSKPLFQLIFQGNTQFLGDTVNLGETRSKLLSFQKAGFGIFNRYKGFSLFLNAVNVSAYAQMNMSSFFLEQNEDGSSIGIKARGDVNFHEGTGFSKGLGICLDAEYTFMSEWINKRRGLFQVSAQNIGFAFLKNTVNYSMNTSLSYSGFKFNQLLTDGILPNTSSEWLDSLGITKTNKERTVLLPGFIQGGKIPLLNSALKWQSFFGVKAYLVRTTIPMVYAGAFYRISPKLATAFSASYGTFGKVRLGTYISYFGKKITASLGSNDLLGWIPAVGFGQSLTFQCAWKIN